MIIDPAMAESYPSRHATNHAKRAGRTGLSCPQSGECAFDDLPQAGRLPGFRTGARRSRCAQLDAAMQLLCDAEPLDLVLWPRRDGDLSRFMQWLTVVHVRRWHAHRHSGGTGQVYQGRFKSFPIQDDPHFLTVCRYVERNALRAKLVRRAEDWRWGSLWRRLCGDGFQCPQSDQLPGHHTLPAPVIARPHKTFLRGGTP